jgi:tetratricopeptide (TPR) repeat protein
MLAVLLCLFATQALPQDTEDTAAGSRVPIPYSCVGPDAPDCIVDALLALAGPPPLDDYFASELAKALGAIGRTEEAEALARPIADVVSRELVFWSLAIEAAENGDFKSAADLIDKGVVYRYRAEALQDLAAAFSKRGDDAGALALISRIDKPSDRAMGLMQQAKRFAKAGQSARARQTMAEAMDMVAPSPTYRGWLMIEGAATLVWLGEDVAARQEVDQLSGLVRDDALQTMASSYGERGDFEQARELLVVISDPGKRGFASAQVAGLAAKAGDVGLALSLAMDAPDHQSRSDVLEVTARALADAGDLEGARSVFSDALAYALADESELRDFVLRNVLLTMAWAGLVDEARAQMGKLGDESDRHSVLAAIAGTQAEECDLLQAFTTTEEIGGDLWRFTSLLDIANKTKCAVCSQPSEECADQEE